MSRCCSYRPMPFLPNHCIHFSSIFSPGSSISPRQHSEYFTMRNAEGHISRFFKTDSPIHGSPHCDVYPHLHGNGGLSIRSKAQCKRSASWGHQAHKKLKTSSSAVTSAIQHTCTVGYAQAFATETTYNPNAIGSHACWKYLEGADLAQHFEQHLRESWAMTTALRHQAS